MGIPRETDPHKGMSVCDILEAAMNDPDYERECREREEQEEAARIERDEKERIERAERIERLEADMRETNRLQAIKEKEEYDKYMRDIEAVAHGEKATEPTKGIYGMGRCHGSPLPDWLSGIMGEE